MGCLSCLGKNLQHGFHSPYAQMAVNWYKGSLIILTITQCWYQVLFWSHTHLILTTTLEISTTYHSPHLTDEETKALKGYRCLQITAMSMLGTSKAFLRNPYFLVLGRVGKKVTWKPPDGRFLDTFKPVKPELSLQSCYHLRTDHICCNQTHALFKLVGSKFRSSTQNDTPFRPLREGLKTSVLTSCIYNIFCILITQFHPPFFI